MPDDASMVRAREDMECHCVTRWSGTERETDNSDCALHNDEVLRILTRDEEIVQLRQALRTLEAERDAYRRDWHETTKALEQAQERVGTLEAETARLREDKNAHQRVCIRVMEERDALAERVRGLEPYYEINHLLQGELAVQGQKLLFAQGDIERLTERVRELEATIANAVATLLVNADGYSRLARLHLEAALASSDAPRERSHPGGERTGG